MSPGFPPGGNSECRTHTLSGNNDPPDIIGVGGHRSGVAPTRRAGDLLRRFVPATSMVAPRKNVISETQ